MAGFRQQFEAELKAKLEQKSSFSTSAETVLLRAFKYFDLDNSGAVNLQEFFKAVEKIGMVVDPQKLEALFYDYDADRSGALDYKEFSSGIFGSASHASPKKVAGATSTGNVQQALKNIRDKLISRGARGIIGLGRQFRIMDDDNSRSLEYPEF